jgi:hypothetical protein
MSMEIRIRLKMQKNMRRLTAEDEKDGIIGKCN